MNKLDSLEELASEHGLVVRGGFEVESVDQVPDIRDGVPARCLVLFGNAGSSLWERFSTSAEYADGLADPMNRWSERIGNDMAKVLGGRAFFPFGGPPYQPFIQWAAKSESLTSSKIGMLIHPEYGLWHAYRFALGFPDLVSGLTMADVRDICLECVDQPCLEACPVSAFSGTGYDVDRCFSYLDAEAQSGCRTTSCAARLACPEGVSFGYRREHARFHMDAFYKNIKAHKVP